MENETFQPILAGIARHGLTSLGGALVTGGYLQSSELSAFVGAGMLFAGVAWSWWQKRGLGLLKSELARLKAPAAAPGGQK